MNSVRGKGLSGKVFQRIPVYVPVCFCLLLGGQLITYYGSRLFCDESRLILMNSPLDEMIPFVPVWITVYLLAYLSWAVSALVILYQSKAQAVRFTFAVLAAFAFSTVIFVLFPGTMTRPEVPGTDIFSALTRFIFNADPALTLCPSYHVMISYFCWRGLYECDRIPAWFRPFNFIFLLLVCMSILFVKQHVLIDIPCAVAIGEVSWQLARIIKPEQMILSGGNK